MRTILLALVITSVFFLGPLSSFAQEKALFDPEKLVTELERGSPPAWPLPTCDIWNYICHNSPFAARCMPLYHGCVAEWLAMLSELQN